MQSIEFNLSEYSCNCILSDQIFWRVLCQSPVRLGRAAGSKSETQLIFCFPKGLHHLKILSRGFKALTPLLQETGGVRCHGDVIIIVSLSLGTDFGVVCSETSCTLIDFCMWQLCVGEFACVFSWKAIKHENQTVCVFFSTLHRGQ